MTLLPLKIEEGATSQGMHQPLETGKGKEADSPLEPRGRKTALIHLNFGPVRTISEF